MTVINTQQRSGSKGGEFTLLETDVYKAKIAAATVEEDQYAEPLNDGTKPEKLVLRWEVTEVTDEQDEDAVGCAVWQRLAPYYGEVRDGGPSKFKAFIDSLREQGHLADFNPLAFDVETLINIQQRISVEKYKKTMGPNVGKDGNKVVSVMPIKGKRAKAPAQPVATAEPIDEGELPF